MSYLPYLIVFVGSGIGGALRHGANVAAGRMLGTEFPFGTLIVNLTGALAMAVVAEALALWLGLPQYLRLFLTTGIIGGYTTFSTLTLDAATLYERGQLWGALAYLVVSIIGGLAAFWSGLVFVRLLAGLLK